MANQNDNNNENEKVMTPVGIRLETEMLNAVMTVKDADNRSSVANTVETLLKSHPRIKRILAAQAETISVGVPA